MEVKNLKLSEIVGICNENVRKDEESIREGIEELKDSIKKDGILEPLTARPTEGGYEIVMGQRRYIAAKEVGLETIPVIIKEISDEDAFRFSAIENVHRRNLSVYDKKSLVEKGIKIYKDFRTLAMKLDIREGTLISWAPFTRLPNEVLDMFNSGILPIKQKHASVVAKTSEDLTDEEKIEKAKLFQGKSPDEKDKIISIMEQNPGATAQDIREIYDKEPTPIKIAIEIAGDGAKALWEECNRRGGLIKPDELIRNKISDFISDLSRKR